MSENCSQSCETCDETCTDRKAPDVFAKEKLHEFSRVKKVYAVVSGKGGVGKSLVTALCAVAMRKEGYRVAVLDADITGPSMPKAFGLKDKAKATHYGILPETSKTGIDVMSINLLLERDTDPVVWRGPMIAGVVKQFWSEVIWQDEDYMFIDMPPGTGDVALTVFQNLPVDGIIIVTSPQELVSMIVEKAVKMAEKMDISVIGLVENLSYFHCPDNGKDYKIFGDSHIDEIAQKYNLQILAKLPIQPEVAALCDQGCIEDAELGHMKQIVEILK